MNFIILWLINYGLIMFAMSVDNIFWISSSPEYRLFKNWTLSEKLHYIFLYRIKTVLTDHRDIIPGIITSFILTIILNFII